MLSAMLVVYGFVSGGPGARALQLTTPSFHSLHNDSSAYSFSLASRGCGNNLGCHLETRVAKEFILNESVEPESIYPFIPPRRQAAWRPNTSDFLFPGNEKRFRHALDSRPDAR